MSVKATFLRFCRAQGQPVLHRVMGFVRLENGTFEYQHRTETAPGVWHVDYRHPLVPAHPANGELLFGHERRGRVLQQQMGEALVQVADTLLDVAGRKVPGITERIVVFDDSRSR